MKEKSLVLNKFELRALIGKNKFLPNKEFQGDPRKKLMIIIGLNSYFQSFISELRSYIYERLKTAV